jgi:hypothetical protein
MPYALCPLIKRAPHVTEKGYILSFTQLGQSGLIHKC